MSVGVLIIFIDNTVVNTALPAISVDLGASTSALQWVIDGLILAGLLLLGGSLGDRFGRRRWMLIGLFIFGAAAVGAALATSSGTLIAMRALQGLGAALVLPATLSIITNVFPRGERAKAIAIWTVVGALGVGIGPVIGGWLVDELSWSAVFWLQLPIVGAAIAGMVIVPESRDERKIPLDIPGAVLGTAGLTALVFGIIRGGEAGWTSGGVLVSLGLAVVILGAFAVNQLRAEHPMLPLRFFRQKDFTGAVLVIGIIMFAMLVSFFFLTQFFQIVQGRSAFQAGLLIIPTSVAMMVGAPPSGKLMHTIGPRYLVLAMAAAMVTGIVMLTGIEVTSSALSVIIPLAIFGFGAGLGMPALTDTVMAAVPEADAGIGSAVNDVSRELGGALGIATIGSVVSGLYRSNVGDALAGAVPVDLVDVASESIGVANVVAAGLPAELATTLTAAANGAFVDAMRGGGGGGGGFIVSAIILVASVVIALTLVPRRMRSTQAESEDSDSRVVTGGFEPVPEPATA